MVEGSVEQISTQDFLRELESYRASDRDTQRTARRCIGSDGVELEIPVFLNHFWPRNQRAGSSIHRIAYRRSFSPLLPRFFIEKLTRKQQTVYDPYMGRGTTPIEAALLGRVPFGNDANPFSRMLVEPRLRPQFVGRVMGRLHALDFDLYDEITPQSLVCLFHPSTLDDLCCLRRYLLDLTEERFDEIDNWIRMLVISSLTGPRAGYLIGPTLHPNQAILPTRLARLQASADCRLPKKSLFDCLRRKAELLTASCDWAAQGLMKAVISQARFLTFPAHNTPQIPSSSVALIVTTPPELNPLDYQRDNWIRCWFVGVDSDVVQVSAHQELDSWSEEMMRVLVELYRILKPGGHCALEIASLLPRKIRWDEAVVEAARAAGFNAVAIVINTSFPARELLERPYLVRKSQFDEVLVLKKPGLHCQSPKAGIGHN